MLMGSSVLNVHGEDGKGREQEREGHTYPMNKMRLGEVTIDPVEDVQSPVPPARRGQYWYKNRSMKLRG